MRIIKFHLSLPFLGFLLCCLNRGKLRFAKRKETYQMNALFTKHTHMP